MIAEYASYAMAARNGFRRLVEMDEAALLSVRRWHGPWGKWLAKTLTRIGNTRGWIIHGLLLQLALGPERWHPTALLAAGALAGTAVSQLLKRICRRPRPRQSIPGFNSLVDDPDQFSFPSGHTTVAFAVVAVLAATANPALAAAELVIAVSIGSSRVYLGAHYPLDVSAAMVLGLITGTVVGVVCGPLLR